jgi:acyl-CoA synthetase (AMP-forming)/AMP-acid ligase II
MSIENLADIIVPGPDVAIVDEHGRCYTYTELHQQCMALANGLVQRGLGPGDPVALLAVNSADFICSYFGILKMGGIVVLINTKLPAAQVDYILKDSKTKLLLTDQEIATDIDTVKFNEFDRFLIEQPFTSHARLDSDPTVIMYTSGSTGTPKGVIISQGNHKWVIEQKSQDLTHGQSVLVAAACYHMNGLSNMATALSCSCKLILLSQYNARSFVDSIQKHHVSFVSGTPTMISMAFNIPGLIENANLDCVDHLWLGSAPLNANLVDNIKKYFKNSAITNSYGMTEVVPKIFGRHPSLPTPTLSVGYPTSGVKHRLVNGVLHVQSPGVCIGYTNRVLPIEDGYFVTNDCFTVDSQGFYYYIGRADDMFVSGGNNIYPREVESAIESHPGVLSSAVIPLNDDIKTTKPYAFVVLRSGYTATEQELKDSALKLIPYSHCPRRIWIVDSLPLNSVNKVDKPALKELAYANK